VTTAFARFGSGPPLLLAHPLVFSKRYFLGAKEVFGARFDTVAVDLRGHGDNEGEVDLDAAADDIGAVLDACGWSAARLGGTSLGAAVVLRFALRRPERVVRLVQDLPGFGPGSRRPPERVAAMAEAFAKADFEAAAQAITEGYPPARAQAWSDALRSDWSGYDPARLGPKLAKAVRAAAAWRVAEPWPSALAALTVPTEILAVKGDPTHPWEIAETMAATLPDARLHARVPSLAPGKIAEQWISVLA